MNYDKLASKESVTKTTKSLTTKKYNVFEVSNGNEALEKIKSLIPEGVSVMNGSSVTLEKIGFVEYLKSGKHPWNNLHDGILKETDKEKQSLLRKQAELSDYYLGSVHAMTEDGQIVIASNTGSQLPHIVFSSPNLIFAVSTKKIVPTLSDAMKRLEEHVVPLENTHMMEKYGVGTSLNKILIFKNENPMIGRKINVILISEDLGF